MSHPSQEEIIPMIDDSSPSSSSPKKRSLPILRVDLTRPSRTSEQATRTSVDYLYSQVSPLLSADRLSVKFAPEVFDFQNIEMEKVHFNKENARTDGEDDEEEEEEGEAAVGEEEEEEEDEEEEEEDYSASVSAILLRRASSRRQTKRRRPSSVLSPDELGRPRRRSSVITTTSAETAISIEEGVTEEHIFQNIRLHKEVLSSVKQQPWPMRKKIKLVKQAKKYVKRHEGELQERLAQSKTTKDMLACCDIIFVKEWQFVKRELANLMNVMVPWELRIKEIESHFGSVVASYFTFLRWLFWVNLMISLILLTFVAIPEIFFADYKNAGERKKPLADEAVNATKLITLWDFEGVLKYSPLFYGYYNSQENSRKGYGYKGPLAYFITGIAVYIYSFVATLKRMAQNSRQSKLSEKDDECVFTWKLFTGWDYMIGNSETAHNRTASIILGFKEALLEEAEKKRDERSWKMLVLRALINLCVLGLFAFSVFAVVSVVKRSANPQNESRRGWWKQNEVTIIVSLITNVFPFLFEILGSMERYHPRKRLRMQLGRIMVLNLLNLYTFIFASFSKINDKTVQLQKIKESLINMTMAASMTMKSVSPTLPALANTMVDDSRAAHSTARQLNCTRVMRCSTMTTQSTSDISSTSISSLATLLLLTSTTIAPPSNLVDRNSTLVLPQNANRTFDTSLQFIPPVLPDLANRTHDTFPQFISDTVNNNSNELEDNDNEIWKLLLPNLTKSTKPVQEKDFGKNSPQETSFPAADNKSIPSNWTIDKIKVTVNTQYNVTDIDDNNRTLPFEFDVKSELDYELERNLTTFTDNETYGDYDMMNDTSTASSYGDLENQTEQSTSTSDDGCYYVTVCTEWSAPTHEPPVEVTTENVDQKSLTTYPTTRPTESPKNIDLSLETHRLNITMRRVLRNLCWETVFGQELVKLTVMDLVLTIISTLMVDFIRALFVRVMNNCWCWDLEKKFPQYGDFKIAENILHLVNNQGMVWMGMFFSPGLPLINLIKLAIMMYLRSWAVLTCNVPHEVVFRASRSNNFYLALLLTMLFLCVLPVSYAIVWVEPSWHCGPFSNYPKIYYLFTNSTKKALPKELHHTLDYIASPGIVIPLLMLLILIIYYLISLTNSLREANNDLKVQLRRERTEERRKVFQMVDRKHRGDFSGDLIDNTPFHKWKKKLTILPNKTSTDSPSDTVPAHAQPVNGDLKSDAKKLMSKLTTKHAKYKASAAEQDERSFLLDETCIDLEPANTSPINVDMKSKHRLMHTDVLVKIHSKQSPIKNIDDDHHLTQKHQHVHDHMKKKEVDKNKKPEDDDFKVKGEKVTDSFKKKHKRKGSASSVSSEDIPEIVITHTTSTDSLLGGGKPFDQSKSSSIDTVIESGEGQKDSTDKTAEKNTKKKEKSTPLKKLQREQESGKKQHTRDEHHEDEEIKHKKEKKEKYFSEDVDRHEVRHPEGKEIKHKKEKKENYFSEDVDRHEVSHPEGKDVKHKKEKKEKNSSEDVDRHEVSHFEGKEIKHKKEKREKNSSEDIDRHEVRHPEGKEIKHKKEKREKYSSEDVDRHEVSHPEGKEIKHKKEKREKNSSEDIDSNEKEAENQIKKHSLRDKKKEDRRQETEIIKREESDVHPPHKKINVADTKRSSKNDKEDSFKEKKSVTPKSEASSGERVKVKDKKHSDHESVEIDYSTESSIEKNKRRKEEKHKRSLHDNKESHETRTGSTKSKQIVKKELDDLVKKQDKNYVRSSKKTSDQHAGSQERDGKKIRKSDREVKGKDKVLDPAESGSRREIGEDQLKEEYHRNRESKEIYKEREREASSCEEEENKKGKKQKREEKHHSVGKNLIREDTDGTERSSISTESSKVDVGKKKGADVGGSKKKKKEYSSEDRRDKDGNGSDVGKKMGEDVGDRITMETQEIPLSSSLINKAEKRDDAGKRCYEDSEGYDATMTQLKNTSKSKDYKGEVVEKFSPNFSKDISSEDEISVSDKTIASKRDSFDDDDEDDSELEESASKRKSGFSTEKPSIKPSKNSSSRKKAVSQDIETNEADDVSVSDYSGKSSNSKSSKNDKQHSSANIGYDRGDRDHNKIFGSSSVEGKECMVSDSDNDVNDNDSSSSDEDSQ